MSTKNTDQVFVPPEGLESRKPVWLNTMERDSWFYWGLLVAGGITTIVWLSATVVLLLISHGVKFSWPPNAPVYPVVLAATYLLFGVYMSHQQLLVVRRRKNRSYERMVGILEVTRTLGSGNDSQTIFDKITSTCRTAYDCDQASLMLMEDQGQTLVVRASSGHVYPVLGIRTPIGEGVAGWVALKREPMILGTVFNRSRFKAFQSEEYPVSESMMVPVLVGKDLYGVLSVTCRSKNVRYDQEDLQSLQVFAEYAEICCNLVGSGEASSAGKAAPSKDSKAA